MTRNYRVGLLVPSSNTTMETELPALLRAHGSVCAEEAFTFHSARIRMRKVTESELRAMNAQARRAAAELADADVDVVATACLVAIMAQGPGHHCVAEQEIRDVLREEGSVAPVVSSAGALVAALQALGAWRIAMITPYTRPLTQTVIDYLRDAGIDVADSVSLEVADNRAVAALDPHDLLDHSTRLDLTGCDALVLSACVQMRSLEVINEIEKAAAMPVISAAIATAWAILRALDLEPVAEGAGALLATAAPSSTECF